MDRILVYGHKADVVEKQLIKHGLEVVEDEPEIVIAFGGDGTFLESEILYPAVPKIFIKHDFGCKKCGKHNFTKMIERLKKGKYKLSNEIKLEAVVNENEKKKLVCLNEINIHYIPPRALRFEVKVNRQKVASHVIADGLVVATPYGSTAYFNAITRKKFKKGIGVAFNNSVIKHKPLVIEDNKVIKIKILRGNGIVVSDCNPEGISIKEGDEIVIKKSVASANFIDIKGLKRKIRDY